MNFNFNIGFIHLALWGMIPFAALSESVLVREEAISGDREVEPWREDGGVWRASGAKPGLKRMRGAETYVVRTDRAPEKGGKVTLVLEREHLRKETSCVHRVSAPWTTATRLETRLAADEAWYVKSLTFKPVAKDFAYAFVGIDAETRETPAAALRFDVETGNPFHLVRDEKGERAELVVRNPADRAIVASVELDVEDYFGHHRSTRFSVDLAPGRTMRRELADTFGKGIRYVTAIVRAEGSVATNRLTYACVDLHEVTPLQPKGEFRLGINFHVNRLSPRYKQLCMDAAVATGCKLVRGDILHFKSNWQTEDKIDFTADAATLEQLWAKGIDVDAIMWSPTPWAMEKTADGKPVPERVFRKGLLRQYGEALARRFGSKVAYYEVGNEWDLSKPEKLPYEAAVRAVREVAEGVKSVCPEATVIPSGFAADSSVRHPSKVVRPMFQENLIRDVQDCVDVHAVHIHSPWREFYGKMSFFLQWRREMGVKIPWYANETAISTTNMRPTDRAAGDTLWKKVLFCWSRGSRDYIWYNLRATGCVPRDTEQGYGMYTTDLHPRTTVAAFSAIAANFRHLAADGVLVDGLSRQVMRFKGVRGGHDVRVVAGWDDHASEGMPIVIATDARRAWQIDTMGNRIDVPVRAGKVVWTISQDPSALSLEDATRAEPDETDLKRVAKRPVKEIRPAREIGGVDGADFCLKEYGQVYEMYKAMPEYADRTWRWWGDLWVWSGSAYKDGRFTLRLTCWDDVHHAEPEDPLKGDCAVVRLGDWRILLLADTRDRKKIKTDLRVLAKPAQAADVPPESWSLTFQPGHHKTYTFSFEPAKLGFKDTIPYNVRVYDNDGVCFKSWMEFSPLDEDPPFVFRLDSPEEKPVDGK